MVRTPSPRRAALAGIVASALALTACSASEASGPAAGTEIRIELPLDVESGFSRTLRAEPT